MKRTALNQKHLHQMKTMDAAAMNLGVQTMQATKTNYLRRGLEKLTKSYNLGWTSDLV